MTAKATLPLFSVRSVLPVAASPAHAYALVSDLTRSGEWSPECLGGEWISGLPGRVGSVFQGHNRRSADVVSWAPVTRGEWTTRAEVLAAEPGRLFSWAMLTRDGVRQESVWTFEIEPAAEGSLLTHAFWMGRPTEGISGFTADMDETERARFFTDWSAKIESDLGSTLARIGQIFDSAAEQAGE